MDQCATLDSFLIIYKEKIHSDISNQELQDLMDHLIKLFQMPNIPLEAKTITFFRRWSEIKLRMELIDQKFIHKIAELNSKLSDSLKEDLFLDFIWPQVQFDFETEDIVEEYFDMIKVLYYRNLTEMLRQFNMIDITKLMLKVTEFENHICCQGHNRNNQEIISNVSHKKIECFTTLILNILQLAIMEYQSQKLEYEQLIHLSIHHLLSFCTKEHSACQVLQLLIVILKLSLKLDGLFIANIFQNFESVSYLVILYNNSEYIDQKVMCIKLFHLISLRNPTFIQKIVLSLLPPQKPKKQYEWLGSDQLFISLFQWVLNMKIDPKITTHLMFDEKLIFQIKEVFELMMSYMYISTDMMKQFVIMNICTLVKMNKENQIFLTTHNHFLNTFPKFLLSYQEEELQEELKSINKVIFDASFKIVSAIFMMQLIHGKVDLLFQWQKLVSLEIFKIEHDDNDRACSNVRTPRTLLRTLYNYSFQVISKSPFVKDTVDQQFWRGMSLYYVSFLQMIVSDLYSSTIDAQSFSQFSSIKQSAKIFIYKNYANINEQWIDYQFLYKLTNSITQLVNLVINRTNFEPTRIGQQFKYQEFQNWINYIFRRLIAQDKDNINLCRVLQTIIQYYAHYIVVNQFSQEHLEDLINLLKCYKLLIITIICGVQQLKSFKLTNPELELLIKETHYIYLELHMSLFEMINDRCSIAYTQGQDYFNHIEEKHTLQDAITQIKNILTEYFINIGKITIFNTNQQLENSITWPFCYELIRMRKWEGKVSESDLNILINQPDSLNEIVNSEEMIAYILDSPIVIELVQKGQINYNEIQQWANAIIEQQERETIIQYQEQHSRQSQILMKDINHTLNKYQKIQQFNQDLFAQEKSIYDKSRTLSLSSN